jgi:hypothetical protein
MVFPKFFISHLNISVIVAHSKLIPSDCLRSSGTFKLLNLAILTPRLSRFGAGSQGIPLKDLVKPVVGMIQSADDYISDALSAHPYASLAWSGVMLLLPVSHSALAPFGMKQPRPYVACKVETYTID